MKNRQLSTKLLPWAAANALRGFLDAAEYKHVILGLIFLKYISDAFVCVRRPAAEVLLAAAGFYCGAAGRTQKEGPP